MVLKQNSYFKYYSGREKKEENLKEPIDIRAPMVDQNRVFHNKTIHMPLFNKLRQRVLFPFQVEKLFLVKNNGTNVEVRLVNEHLYKALLGSGFIVLDITHLSEFRADAHPSAAGGKKHNDCMHWCLPGLTDTWNDLFIEHLYNIKNRS